MSRERLPGKSHHEVSRAPRREGRFPKSIFEVDAPTLLSIGVKSAADAPTSDATCHVVLEPARNELTESEVRDFAGDLVNDHASVFRFAPVTIQPISNPDDVPNLVRVLPNLDLHEAAKVSARKPKSEALPSRAAEETVVDEPPKEPIPSVVHLTLLADVPVAQVSETTSDASDAPPRSLRSDSASSVRPSSIPARAPVDARNNVTRHAIPRVPLRDSFGDLDEVPSAQRTPRPPPLHAAQQTGRVLLVALAALVTGGASVWLILAATTTAHTDGGAASTPLHAESVTGRSGGATPVTAAGTEAIATNALSPEAAPPAAAAPATATPVLNVIEPSDGRARDLTSPSPKAANAKKRKKRAASAAEPNANQGPVETAAPAPAKTEAAQKPSDPLGAGPVFKWGEG